MEELVGQGADTVLLGPRNLQSLAEKLGTRFTPYEAESTLDYDWSRPEGRDKHGLGPENGDDWFHRRVLAEFAEVDRAARTFRPDVIVTDSFVVGAGLAAEKLGVPWVSYVHYLFDESADTDAMYRVWWERPGTPDLDAYCAWWDGIRAAVGLDAEPRRREEAPWFRMSPQSTFLLGHPHLRRGHRPLPDFVSRTSLRPWDERGHTEASTAIAATASPRPRVLLANSSAWQEDFDLVLATLDGLRDLDVEVLATVSAAHPLPDTPPSNATVMGYHSHTEVMPSVDAVVTTSGYGIASKALWFGKPLVTVPHARDQHYVADAVEKAGCGISLTWPPEPDAVRSAVQGVLSSDSLSGQVSRLSGPMPGFASAGDVAADIISRAGRS
ncbi:glycosyltransferase [Streptomyces avidinii]|uniref:glycosyltransferase n=1 Tax=Streptomyces avidinii TaxID=1895 RepID=UPI0037B1F40B